jgi:hypothetical protein
MSAEDMTVIQSPAARQIKAECRSAYSLSSTVARVRRAAAGCACSIAMARSGLCPRCVSSAGA